MENEKREETDCSSSLLKFHFVTTQVTYIFQTWNPSTSAGSYFNAVQFQDCGNYLHYRKTYFYYFNTACTDLGAFAKLQKKKKP
jgi:hypothetical protein